MSSEEETFVDLSCEGSDIEYDQESTDNLEYIEGNNDNGAQDSFFGIVPYNFEPSFSDKESDDGSSETSEEETESSIPAISQGIQRLQNTEWCGCFNCVAMPTVEESICCQEIEQVSNRKGDHTCIIAHPGFEAGCLNINALQIAYFAYRQDHGHREGTVNERYRYIAYRQLARWCWGFLGKEMRVPLTACAVQRIREEFPSDDYKGFKPDRDLPPLDI